VDGFLLIDKPAGCTSRDACVQVGRALGLRTGRRGTRIGHAGTLDPFATGLLVVAVGRATRLVQFLAGHDKRYLVDVMLGCASSTDDINGDITTAPILATTDLTVSSVQNVVERIAARAVQVPPAVSAIHVNGERAYARVRRGEHVVMKPRPVRFESVEVTGVRLEDGQAVVSLDVRCGPGTYMRSLARDLGAELGGGGLACALRRVHSGAHDVRDAVTLADVSPASLRPMCDMVSDMHRVQIAANQVRDIAHGRSVEVPASDCSATAVVSGTGTAEWQLEPIAIVGPVQELVAVGHAHGLGGGSVCVSPNTVVVRPEETALWHHEREVMT
jgi:tRNA pseudouridine55 synthase